jgi:hypothetical protein
MKHHWFVPLLFTLFLPIALFALNGQSDADFPETRFISAVGMGATPKEAENSALSLISRFFHTTVQAEEALVKSVVEIEDGENSDTFRELDININLIIGSASEFRGVRFSDPWFVERAQMWYIRGYIDKEEARRLYQNRIEANQNTLNVLVNTDHETGDLLAEYRLLRDAVAIATLIEADIDGLHLLEDTSWTMPDYSTFRAAIFRIKTARNEFLPRITFDARIEGDRQGRIQRKLLQILEQNRYIASPGRAVYTFVGEITAAEEEKPAGLFVRAGISLRLVDTDDREVFSFTDNYSPVGARTWDMAYNLAFRNIESELEAQFIEEFNAFIGD